MVFVAVKEFLPKSVDEARNTVMDMMVNTTDIYGEAGRIMVVQNRLGCYALPLMAKMSQPQAKL